MKYVINGKEVRVFKRLPKGWKVKEGTLTQPVGTRWASNGKPLFKKTKDGYKKNPEYRQALVVTNEELMIYRAAEDQRTGRKSGFIFDQKTEERVRSEARRQKREIAKMEKEREKRMRKNSAAKKPGEAKRKAKAR